MKFVRHFVPAALVAASLFSLSAMANPAKGSNLGDPTAPTASSTAVDNLHTAMTLVRYGDANKDAFSLITAARIMKQVGSSASTAEVVTANPGEKKPDRASVDAVLSRAKEYAQGRQDLVAMIDDVAKSGARGAVGGAGRKTTVVSRGTTDSYRVNFKGGERALVVVSGDGDSDLDLFVIDENGNEVCKDADATDDMVCGWSPKWTGPFTIKVKNLGMANQYTIVHN